ncbi:hypothetical protein [Natronorubrum sp. A-ect3]|uniref:hypothetical protein n=1 Tax=Natronorubrum sp. A-ect3 TaxID=3242698 RepID=UPI00359D8881
MTIDIARHALHRGCDFILRKGTTDSIKVTIEEETEGKADWTIISEGRFDEVGTTLVTVEKNFKSIRDSSDKDEDGKTRRLKR